MRFLIDECVSGHLVEALRRKGYDASWAAEVCSGADDATVMTLAFEESRIVVTFDRGIGARAMRLGAAAIGVVILGAENQGESLAGFAARIADWIDAAGENELLGKLTILEADRTRQRDLPAVADRT